MKIKTIFTDLDGVIRIWGSYLLDLEIKFNIPKNSISKILFSKNHLLPAITGKITYHKWFTAVAKNLNQKYEIENFNNFLEEFSMPSQNFNINKLILEKYKELFPLAKIVLVTNATSILETNLNKTIIPSYLDLIINSYDLGFAKPDKRFYLKALELANTDAKSSLFIDDHKINVDAAKKLGFKTIHFQDPNQCIKELEEYKSI